MVLLLRQRPRVVERRRRYDEREGERENRGERSPREEERRRLHQEQYAHALRSGSSPVLESQGDPLDYGAILSAARDLLKGMFRH